MGLVLHTAEKLIVTLHLVSVFAFFFSRIKYTKCNISVKDEQPPPRFYLAVTKAKYLFLKQQCREERKVELLKTSKLCSSLLKLRTVFKH